MPLYEYKCFKCNHKLNRLHKINEKHTIKCPKCDSYTKKIISLSNFQLKGKGWYKTDFKNK